ncbi:RidA family protein [Actinoallomurus iriomotensis]|uniref:Translation initiation inhibitor n=1 Tax=Actinoallomurus iriomotensis TaxID=478107 RepID=A0A9W6W4X7_9ACTN|nr:RidA family protein [Actinoallomurus iriomotensis]GLY90909.1 translation initiation inhibitor [Actinoallomurus iriomotensis]
MVRLTAVDPIDAPEAAGGYTQALSVEAGSRLLFVSGQIPETREGEVPQDFEDQCRLVWTNILAALREANLDASNLVKVTTFLSDRRYADINSRVRREILGEHRPALTVIIAEIYDSQWLLEIEAIAAG